MKPPIDPDFYAIGANSGMTDDEIQADWDAYCDDLEKFHKELDAKNTEEITAFYAKAAQPNLTEDLKAFFKDSDNG